MPVLSLLSTKDYSSARRTHCRFLIARRFKLLYIADNVDVKAELLKHVERIKRFREFSTSQEFAMIIGRRRRIVSVRTDCGDDECDDVMTRERVCVDTCLRCAKRWCAVARRRSRKLSLLIWLRRVGARFVAAIMSAIASGSDLAARCVSPLETEPTTSA